MNGENLNDHDTPTIVYSNIRKYVRSSCGGDHKYKSGFLKLCFEGLTNRNARFVRSTIN